MRPIFVTDFRCGQPFVTVRVSVVSIYFLRLLTVGLGISCFIHTTRQVFSRSGCRLLGKQLRSCWPFLEQMKPQKKLQYVQQYEIKALQPYQYSKALNATQILLLIIYPARAVCDRCKYSRQWLNIQTPGYIGHERTSTRY